MRQHSSRVQPTEADDPGHERIQRCSDGDHTSQSCLVAFLRRVFCMHLPRAGTRMGSELAPMDSTEKSKKKKEQKKQQQKERQERQKRKREARRRERQQEWARMAPQQKEQISFDEWEKEQEVRSKRARQKQKAMAQKQKAEALYAKATKDAPEPKRLSECSAEEREASASFEARRATEQSHGACTFYFVLADHIRAFQPDVGAASLPRFQELVERGWLTTREVSLADVISGGLVREHMAISHRWLAAHAPDEAGHQLAAVKEYLCAPEHSDIRLVWFE
jgi:hypothetical protein